MLIRVSAYAKVVLLWITLLYINHYGLLLLELIVLRVDFVG